MWSLISEIYKVQDMEKDIGKAIQTLDSKLTELSGIEITKQLASKETYEEKAAELEKILPNDKDRNRLKPGEIYLPAEQFKIFNDEILSKEPNDLHSQQEFLKNNLRIWHPTNK